MLCAVLRQVLQSVVRQVHVMRVAQHADRHPMARA